MIQSGHYGVSLLLADDDPSTLQRIGLAILIPNGVFVGSSLNQVLLAKLNAVELLARAYWLLPLACIGYAAAVASGWLAALVPSLVVLGMLTGMLMPLGPAVIVSWYPGIRGSAAASESIAKAIGATLSPVLLGLLVAEHNLAAGLLGVAAVALLGAVATLGFARRTAIA